MDTVKNAVAVITGAGSGIGRATAFSLARAGASVVVSDLNLERCEDVVAEIVAHGGRAHAAACDVSLDEDVEALRDVTLESFGRVDIVMNNVGVLAFGQPQNIPMDAWTRIVNTNLLSVARSIHTFLPLLVEQGSGHFVNTASTAGLYAYSFERLPYSATKGAVVAMSEALALYCQPRGIGVTLLCPGPVATNIAEQMTVYGEIGPIQAPELELLDPRVVGDQVLEAILHNTFFLPTHGEVNDILRSRAADMDSFVRAQAEKLA